MQSVIAQCNECYFIYRCVNELFFGGSIFLPGYSIIYITHIIGKRAAIYCFKTATCISQPHWVLISSPEDYMFSSAAFYEKGKDEFNFSDTFYECILIAVVCEHPPRGEMHQ